MKNGNTMLITVIVLFIIFVIVGLVMLGFVSGTIYVPPFLQEFWHKLVEML